MKTAVSVPDPVFEEAETYARRTGKSRSQLYSEALAEYLDRHAGDAVTEALDEVCATLQDPPGAFLRKAGRRLLRREKW